jgi:hypothetical protein
MAASRPLFSKMDIFAVQQHQQEKAKEAVRQLPQQRFTEDESTLAAEIASAFTMELPVLDESGIYQSDRQVQLDARGLPNRMVFDRSRPVPVDGTEITIHVPFKGDPALFDVRPSQFSLNPPFAQIDSRNGEILLTYRTADANFNIKAQYERTLQEIKQHLEWLRPAAMQTDGVKQTVLAEIAKRKQATEVHSKVVDSVGLRRRPPKQA